MAGKCNRCQGSGRIRTKDRSTWEIITNQPGTATCPKCNGSGEYSPSGNSSSSYSNRGYSSPSRDSMWAEKSCAGLKGAGYCGNTIKYRRDWDKIPDICPSCREKAKAQKAQNAAMWAEKSCPGLKGGSYCGNTIKYRRDWDKIPDICPSCREKAKAQKAQRDAEWKEKECKNPLCRKPIKYNITWAKIPDYCKSCSSWKEKACATATCRNTIRYLAIWDNIPSYCEDCKRKSKESRNLDYSQALSKDYPSINSVLPGTSQTAAQIGGDKVIVLSFAGGIKHVTVYAGEKPTGSRYSWNVDANGDYIPGSAHITDRASRFLRKQFSDERWHDG